MMHEIVKLYDNLIKYNGSVHEDDRLCVELWTHPLAIVFWDVFGDEVKRCNSFQSANKWIERWIKIANER